MSISSILHIDMDAFYASVAELDHPELRGKAVVVGGGSRGVVLSANYAARKFGIRAAIPVIRAKRMAPNAIFISPDHHRYSEMSQRVMKIFGDFTPYVEPLSLDEAFLDVTGVQKLIGSPREIGVAIRARVEKECGITCSVGIGPNKFIAKLASQHCKPNGLLEIRPDRIIEFLHPLPVNAIWGVGPKTNEILEKLGLRTVADIANLPKEALIRALGEATGEHLYELAWGRDQRDVIVEEPDKSISNAETFDSDEDDPEIILAHLLALIEKASGRMRERKLFAKTISIKVRFANFTTINRSKTLALPISSSHEIYEVAKQLWSNLGLERARIRLVGVELSNLCDNAPEQLLLGGREKGWREAENAADLARNRFGDEKVRPARLYKSEER